MRSNRDPIKASKIERTSISPSSPYSKGWSNPPTHHRGMNSHFPQASSSSPPLLCHPTFLNLFQHLTQKGQARKSTPTLTKIGDMSLRKVRSCIAVCRRHGGAPPLAPTHHTSTPAPPAFRPPPPPFSHCCASVAPPCGSRHLGSVAMVLHLAKMVMFHLSKVRSPMIATILRHPAHF
jgi:hypothetical protein